MLTFVTYNGHTSSFCLNTVAFEFEESGTIVMSHSIQAFSSEVYKTSDDFFRLCLELLFLLISFINLGSEISEVFVTKIETGKFSNCAFAHLTRTRITPAFSANRASPKR
jgi:hypothetical protein